MNKKLHEIRKEEFQIAKINVRLLQNAKRFCKMQDAKCNCKIQNANDLIFKKVFGGGRFILQLEQKMKVKKLLKNIIKFF